jgi:predicted small secreted protein
MINPSPKENPMKPLIAVLLILTALGLSACETVAGMGRDITNASETVHRNM